MPEDVRTRLRFDLSRQVSVGPHIGSTNDDIASRWGPRITDLLHIVETAITNGNIDNRLWQFLLHWDGLRTACARAGAHLSLFCH